MSSTSSNSSSSSGRDRSSSDSSDDDFTFTVAERISHSRLWFAYVLDCQSYGNFGFKLITAATFPTEEQARAALGNGLIVRVATAVVPLVASTARQMAVASTSEFDRSKYPHCRTFIWQQMAGTCATFLWKFASHLSSPPPLAMAAVNGAHSHMLTGTDQKIAFDLFVTDVECRHCVTLLGVVATVIARFAYGSGVSAQEIGTLAAYGGAVAGNLTRNTDIYWSFVVRMAYFFETELSQFESVDAQSILHLDLHQFELDEKARLHAHGFWSSKGIRQLLRGNQYGLTAAVQNVMRGPSVTVISALALILPDYVDIHPTLHDGMTILQDRHAETADIGKTFEHATCLSISKAGDIGKFSDKLMRADHRRYDDESEAESISVDSEEAEAKWTAFLPDKAPALVENDSSENDNDDDDADDDGSIASEFW